ncbi:MAG: flavodoxin domain-containing protein [Chloroflexota bacterium]|nr:flavodoxin domain-containing protein [Chloroflexota bacterium]
MPKVLILYDTRTGNTGRMARAVAEGADSVGKVKVILKRVGEGEGELADADAIILGSPTHSTKPSRAMKGLLSGLSKILLKDKVGAAFGSYGWSGEAPGIMVHALKDQGVRVIGAGLRVRRTPGVSDLTKCRDLGCAVAQGVTTNEGQGR